MQNIVKLHKYTVVWFLVLIASAISLADSLASIIITTAFATALMVMANVAIRRLARGLGEWWTFGTFVLGFVTLISFAAGGCSVNMGGTIVALAWFGLIMGAYAFIEISMSKTDGDDGLPPLFVGILRAVYGFFLLSSMVSFC